MKPQRIESYVVRGRGAKGSRKAIATLTSARQCLECRGLEVISRYAREERAPVKNDFALYLGEELWGYALLEGKTLVIYAEEKLPERITREQMLEQKRASGRKGGRPRKPESKKRKQRAVYVIDALWPEVQAYIQEKHAEYLAQ